MSLLRGRGAVLARDRLASSSSGACSTSSASFALPRPCRAPASQRAAPSQPHLPHSAGLLLPSSPHGQQQQGSQRCAQLTARYQMSYVGAAVGVVEKEEELLLPLPSRTESAADDPLVANPLERHNRLSTGWFGVIMDFEGVVVESHTEAQQQAWLQVADEFGYKRPLGQLMRRIKGVKDEAVVSRVFGWTHNPSTAKQVAKRKAEVLEQVLGGRQPAAMLEARPFLDTLKRYSIPVALATPQHEAAVQEGLKRHNLASYFDALVTAEDSGSAEVEFYYAYAAQRIRRPPIRCVVVGESNTTVEAAHELGMKCVVVTGNQPVYDFVGADLVVRNLSQLSFMNLKRLFGSEELVEGRHAEEERLGGGGNSSGSLDTQPDDFDDFDDDFDDDFGETIKPPPGFNRYR